jgi:predicted metalloendopeptidase
MSIISTFRVFYQILIISTLANYIVWNAVNAQVGYFPASFVEASLLLSKVESGIKGLDPRWQRCISKVNREFGFASSALYVQEYFAKESKSKVGNPCVLNFAKSIGDEMHYKS